MSMGWGVGGDGPEGSTMGLNWSHGGCDHPGRAHTTCMPAPFVLPAAFFSAFSGSFSPRLINIVSHFLAMGNFLFVFFQ